MNQSMLPTSRIRPAHVRPETASALREMAFVLSLARRVREEMLQEVAQQSR